MELAIRRPKLATLKTVNMLFNPYEEKNTTPVRDKCVESPNPALLKPSLGSLCVPSQELVSWHRGQTHMFVGSYSRKQQITLPQYLYRLFVL